ncbi:DUF1802 family protein [Methanobacterium bryantii]|uniref:Restriction endonuclease n=1 Tax=Methanobacterium bryantii TaxID=2161 RepID=A0A2A2H7Y8_METBR|nr:DUF1802 family protein [Methanobacterium bryantii]PAV05455.1 restriction endonuclease [Methanobacterium bryantii]
METITKCLNEWNATIEALGQGKQTILIRKYRTNVGKFLLYPTVSYALKDNYLESFRNEYQPFAEKNALPKKDNRKTEVKYFATVEKVIERSSQRIGSLKEYHIWTNEHVKSYLDNQKAYIWILRVYKLKEPVMSERTMAKVYSNLLEEVSLGGIEPVLNGGEFSKIVQEIK